RRAVSHHRRRPVGDRGAPPGGRGEARRAAAAHRHLRRCRRGVAQQGALAGSLSRAAHARGPRGAGDPRHPRAAQPPPRAMAVAQPLAGPAGSRRSRAARARPRRPRPGGEQADGRATPRGGVMPRLFVLDAMNLAYRAYYAFIRRPLVNSKGENTSAIYGFAGTLNKLRREEDPDHWALAWDGPGRTFRHDQFPDYKATRKPMPADFLAQIPAIEDLAQAFGLPVLEIPGMEADDVMGTLAACAEREGWDVTLVTGDKDMFQLGNDRVKVLCPTGKGEEYARIDRDSVKSKWGVWPEQMRDVLALMGDTSDNVPGVPGVGEKTAVELISAFGSLDALYERLGEVKREGLRSKLEAHRSLAMLSRELVTVKTDLPLPVQLADLRRGMIRRDGLIAIAERYAVRKLVQIANDLGVDDESAGRRVHARDAARRGHAAESQAASATLAMPDATGAEVEPEIAALPLEAAAAELPVPRATPAETVHSAPAAARALPRVERVAPQGTLGL